MIPSLKLGDYISVQVHKPCSISLINLTELFWVVYVEHWHNMPENEFNIVKVIVYVCVCGGGGGFMFIEL